VDWIHLVQDSDQWWALVSMVMNFYISKERVFFLAAVRLLVSQGFCSIEFAVGSGLTDIKMHYLTV
jgi:hypothetical protein